MNVFTASPSHLILIQSIGNSPPRSRFSRTGAAIALLRQYCEPCLCIVCILSPDRDRLCCRKKAAINTLSALEASTVFKDPLLLLLSLLSHKSCTQCSVSYNSFDRVRGPNAAAASLFVVCTNQSQLSLLSQKSLKIYFVLALKATVVC